MMDQKTESPLLVLGSGSATRARILQAAGVPFSIKSPKLDERTVFARLVNAGVDVTAGALELAELKALEVGRSLPKTIVVSADQILECEGVWFQKASDLVQARANLERLSDRKHRLISAIAVAHAGDIIWRYADQAVLSMRRLSPTFLNAYFETVGDSALDWAGGYQIESIGAQLFNGIEGDYTTVLGLPLIPLLGFLRTQGILEC